MIQYRFRIGNRSDRAFLNNDEEADKFSEFIGAEWERDTAIFKLKKDNKFCTFELEIKDAEIVNSLEFKNVNIWEV